MAIINTGASIVGSPLSVADVEDGGACTLADTVKIAGTPDVPVARRVDLFCVASKRLVRSTWSSPAGNYIFTAIRPGPWMVIAYDHTGTYNAVIADNITVAP